ncbi:MAG: hypothetical protein AAGF11_08915 [Myxococcota bacterium]
MFIAIMYAYGSDIESVGVDGIRGCLGIFLATDTRLYAIHIPDAPNHFDAGRAAFVHYVNQTEPNFNQGTARLFAVMNGPNRPAAYAELLAYANDLGVHRLETVRINEHLGQQGFGQDAAAIVCERIPGSTNCRLKYTRGDDILWQNNGTARADLYRANMQADDDRLSTNPALGQGWHMVDDTNSTIATTNW